MSFADQTRPDHNYSNCELHAKPTDKTDDHTYCRSPEKSSEQLSFKLTVSAINGLELLKECLSIHG